MQDGVMQDKMKLGVIASGIGHAGAILWVVLGDFLFTATPPEEPPSMSVSMISAADFAEMQAQSTPPSDSPPTVEPAGPEAPETPAAEPVPEPAPEPEPEVTPAPRPEPQPQPAPEPEPQPEAQPAPEPLPEPLPEPEPEPLPVSPEPQPEDVAVAPVDQPLPSMSSSTRPKPKPADVVSPVVETPPEEAVTAETPTPAVSETPVETPVEPPKEATQEVVPEDTGDVLRTEATEDQTEALGMTASVRPKSKPARPKPTETPAKPAASESPSSAATAEDSSDSDADAIAAAVAAAAAEEEPAASSGAQGGGRSGPPLTAGEIGDISSVIGKKWNVGSLSTDALSSVVVLRVEFSPDGRPGNITLIESSGPSQAGIQVAFDAARRAIQIAYRDGGIPLPADKYDTWKVLEFSFDGNGMRLR